MQITRSRAALLVWAFFALALFAWLGEAVLRGHADRLDLTLRTAVHAWASPPLTAVMRAITAFGDPVVLVPLGLLLFWRLTATGRRRAATAFVVAVLGGEILEQILKLLFQRARPEAFFGYPAPATYSFPSGHSFISACFYGAATAILTSRSKSLPVRVCAWTFAAALSALIGLSRIYLGVHHPSDVLAGYAGAIVWVTAVSLVFSPLRRARLTTDSTE